MKDLTPSPSPEGEGSAATRIEGDLTPSPSPEGEGSAATRIEGGSSYQWIWLVLASVAYYLSFIPIFFALIGVLVIGNYFGGRWPFRANERGNGKQALTTLVMS